MAGGYSNHGLFDETTCCEIDLKDTKSVCL